MSHATPYGLETVSPTAPRRPRWPSRPGSRGSSTRAPRPTAFALLAAWAVASLVYASHLYLFHTVRGFETRFGFQLAEASLHLGIWALLSPAVIRLAAARPLTVARRPGRLALHLGCGLAFALLQLLVHAALDHALLHGADGGLPGLAERVTRLFTRTYYANVLLYLALAAAAGVWASRRERSAEAEREPSAEGRSARRAGRRPPEAAPPPDAPLGYQDFVTVESQGRLRVLPVRDIDGFVSERNYVEVIARDASYRLRGSLKEIEARLDPRRFLRTHRSAIVNLASVAEIRPLFGDSHEIVLRTGRRLPLSRRHRTRLPELL